MKKLLLFMAGFACATLLITYFLVDEPIAVKDTVCKENVYAAEAETDRAEYEKNTAPVWERTEMDNSSEPETPPEEAIEDNYAERVHIIDLPHIYQKERYPNACESVSAVMALQYLGYDITVDEFIDEYLPKGDAPWVGHSGPDPSKVYLGDPRSVYGWGCYAPVIEEALNEYLADKEHRVSVSYADTLKYLCDNYVSRDVPVIVWATVGMTDARDEGYYRYWNTPEGKSVAYNSMLHCLVLVGYDENYYYFNDPLVEYGKRIAYPKLDCEKAFFLLGRQAVIISD